MKKMRVAASIVWCSFLLAPYFLTKMANDFLIHARIGFFSIPYAIGFFLFENLENKTIFNVVLTFALPTLFVLDSVSLLYIICEKGKEIHITTLLATFGEMLFQLAASIHYTASLSMTVKLLFEILFPPLCILLLLIWLVYLWIKQRQEKDKVQ